MELEILKTAEGVFVTPRAAAAKTSLTENSWYYLCRAGKVTAFRLGGRVLMPVAQVVEILAGRGLMAEAESFREHLA